jgi:pimeloyl-ACP methyl ester carboxylesterase
MKKQFVRLVGLIFPKVLVNFAYKALTNPQILKLRSNELAVLEKASKNNYSFGTFSIKTYQWGSGSRKVLLIHGWEGQAGNFSDMVLRLIKEDYTVFSFDGPSHGFSSRGPTSLLAFTDLVGEMIRHFGVEKVVSHSFGGVATTYALYKDRDLRLSKYVMLTTPDKFSDRIDTLSQKVGISSKIKKKLISRLEAETGLDVQKVKVSDWVKEINVAKALILHDKNDRVLPISVSKAVNDKWEACILEEVEGTGHFAILREPKVLDRVLSFLN